MSGSPSPEFDLSSLPSYSYPLKLEPIFQERVWGQQDLAFLYPQRPSEPFRVGEVWLTGDHNRVANGPWAGATLSEVAHACGPALLGKYANASPEVGSPLFPLLVKFLFTSEKLSVQVHPPDSYARAREGSAGKTEMWHILKAGAGARLAVGFRKDLSPNWSRDRCAFRAAVESGEIERVLDWVEVKTGETFFVPAGTVHAIGPELVICEIQQNSDITYRLYDYKRPGTDGHPRPLHVEKALDVLEWNTRGGRTRPVELATKSVPRLLLAACPYFATEKLRLDAVSRYETQARVEIWIGLAGEVHFEGGGERVPCRKGEALVIPADMPSFTIHPISPSIFLRTYPPGPQVDLGAELLRRGFPAENVAQVVFSQPSKGTGRTNFPDSVEDPR
ncbi:MAG: class I mannose-6-phosphate isomerase [Acidobacteria bacterium]|nr:class I mannose-6-phosphate isomerase [Acidobacteriota bacterium]